MRITEFRNALLMSDDMVVIRRRQTGSIRLRQTDSTTS